MASPLDAYTDALDKANKVNLIGGSVVFLITAYAVRQNNLSKHPWHVSDTLIICGLALAAICVIASVVLRMYTLRLREQVMEKNPSTNLTDLIHGLPMLAVRANDPVKDMALVHTDPSNTAVTNLIKATAIQTGE